MHKKSRRIANAIRSQQEQEQQQQFKLAQALIG